MKNYITLQLIIILFLIILSAFFSMVETAFFSLSRVRVKRLKMERFKKGKLIETLLSNPRVLMTNIIIGNMTVNIAATSIASAIFLDLYGEKSLTLSIVVMSLVILFFGEIIPKVVAVNYSEPIAIFTASGVNLMSAIFAPFRKILRFITEAFMPLFNFLAKGSEAKLTEEELETAFSGGFTDEVLDSKERGMIRNIFRLSDKRAIDIMQPKDKILILDINTSIKEILGITKDKRFSRVPIYENDKENIVGILFIKDLLEALSTKKEDINIREILRPVYYIPQYMKCNILLRDLRHKKIHLAIVVDEYGALSGLVTLEDLLEEIVGEIKG